jgi:type I restriction enzyme S subunit
MTLANSKATTGRKTTALGNALGNRPPMNLSPEGAAQNPENWEMMCISDFACASTERVNPNLSRDSPYIGLEHIDKDTGKLVGKGAAADVVSTKSVFREGDLLYGKLRPYLNKVWIAEFDGFCSTDILVFPKSEAFDNKFLKYRFLSQDFVNYANANSSGVNLPRVSSKVVGKFKINLPPLPEQRRIVARIEELFSRLAAGVAALRQAKAQLQRYRQSVLAAAVTGQLTQAWREQHPDTESGEDLLKRILGRRREEWNGRGKYTKPVDHDSSDLKELPKSWTWSSFEGVLTELRNGISKKPDATDGLRILRISAVRPLAVDLDDSRFLSDSLSKFATYELEPNDLLFTRYNGTRAFVGVCGLVPKLPEPFVYPDKLIRARLVDQHALLPSFVEIAMNAGESRRFLEKRIRTTAGQSGISGGDIKVTPLPIPPLAEQHQIVAEVEARTTAIDHLEAELDRQITRSNRLRQSALAAAFLGKLEDRTT